MQKIRSGIIGTGFMGAVHTNAVRAAGGIVQAYAGRNPETTRVRADAANVPLVLSPMELINSDEIDLVHICTPNAQHVELAAAAIAAGKHVICEKPLALDQESAQELADAAAAAGVVNAVPFVYRFYPTIRETKERIAALDERVWLAHGHYLQDWLSNQNSFNWRVADGSSRAFADIGVHWCDLLEFTTGHRIVRLLAQRSRLHDTRILDGDEVPVLTEDGVTMLFETDQGASGSVVISQATPGRKNRLWLSLDGESNSYVFDQENPNELWIGSQRSITLIPKGEETMGHAASPYLLTPAGHPQGYQDCFTLFMGDVHRAISGQQVPGLPTFADGLRAAKLTEAVVQSSNNGQWAELGEGAEELAEVKVA